MPVQTSNLPLVVIKIRAIESQALEAAATGMKRGLDNIVQISQRQFLQGPRSKTILGEVSGRLRNSLTRSVQIQEGRGIIGHVGTKLAYAAFHENGFHGVEHVKAHTRVVSQVSGKGESFDGRTPITANGQLVGHRQSRKGAASKQKTGFAGVQFVKAHDRNINYAGRPFLRPAVAIGLPQLITEIQTDLNKLANS